MKTIAFENKNTLVGINSTLDSAEEKIGVREDQWKKKPEDQWGMGTQNIRGNGWNCSKLEENFKPTDPRSLMNPRDKKHEENYAKACHNQNA